MADLRGPLQCLHAPALERTQCSPGEVSCGHTAPPTGRCTCQPSSPGSAGLGCQDKLGARGQGQVIPRDSKCARRNQPERGGQRAQGPDTVSTGTPPPLTPAWPKCRINHGREGNTCREERQSFRSLGQPKEAQGGFDLILSTIPGLSLPAFNLSPKTGP